MTTWAFSYKGVAWGEGTDVDVLDIEGLLGFTDTARATQRLTHGGRPGISRVTPRTFTMAVDVPADDSTDLAAALDALAVAWSPSDDEQPLTFDLGAGERRINCRPTRVVMPANYPHSIGFASGVIEWEASDPRHYSEDAYDEETARATPGAGLDPPFTPPLSLPASTSTGSLTLTNAGTAPVGWTALLEGPLVNPRLTHVGTGEYLDFSANGGLNIASGQSITIDTDDRSVLLAGTGDRRPTLALPESTWWLLDPGDNEVRLDADSGAGTVTFTWRDGWWG